MRVGTRITVTTSTIVAVALAVYAFFNFRSHRAEQKSNLLREARDYAANFRAAIESLGVDEALANAKEITAAMAKTTTYWDVALLDAALVSERVKRGQAQDVALLRKILQLRTVELTSEARGQFVYMLPLRVPSPDDPDGFEVVGAIRLKRNLANLRDERRADLAKTAITLAAILAMLVVAVWLSVRLLVGEPIGKLIAGIDDVAQGDLSRVLLQERDDEIGALATRFNEMTGSLRESRAETARQNQAKLTLEQQLSETAKLATMGQLAAEIAHEVGTPLNVIGGRARNLARKAGDPAAVERNANIIAEQAGRITRIIQRLLDFTRRKVGSIDNQPVNLNEITLTTMEFLEGQFAKANVRHTLARAEGLPRVSGNPDQLQQVFLNLFLNALQAMPGGGHMSIETSAVTRKRPGLEADPEQLYVEVDVADTGVGIPQEERDKIFEAFYTSKQDSGGTGLGLAVCHGIVKEHDGWIEVDDAVRGGTVFRVFLPALSPS